MSPIAAQCPGCGARIVFRVDSSVVTVCEFCSAAVARADQAFEDLGKIADLVQSESPLTLWLDGKYGGSAFQLTGRAQMQHSAGGIWDEWYLAFDDGRWGWLAEAQGRYYLTFETPEAGAISPYASLRPGESVVVAGSDFAVAEKGEAVLLSARGEIPYRLEPGFRYPFADLSGAGGHFATIDYGDEPPTLYLGSEVALADLGIAASAPAQEHESRQVAAQRLACPNCDGSVELHAPDKTERVGCPFCGSLLDVNQGNLVFLKALEGRRVEPRIPLGRVGEFEGHPLKVLGFMQRSVTFDTTYYWEEYLLYHPRVGFRWLTCSDARWNYVYPVAGGDVAGSPTDFHYAGETVGYQGNDYRVFQDSVARVEYVVGEFYWKVSAGDQTSLVDYVRGNQLLSAESTQNEINWSLSTYMTRQEVGAPFQLELPYESSGVVAPNQPYPHKRVYKYFGILMVLAVIAMIAVGVTRSNKNIMVNTYDLEMQTSQDKPQVIFSDPFKLVGNQNIAVTMRSPVSNGWVFVQGHFVSETTGLAQEFQLPIEFYSGTSGGEYWTEGSSSETRYVHAVPPGEYTLVLGVSRNDFRSPSTLQVLVRQGVQRVAHGLFLILGLLLLPFLVLLHHWSFEKRRWSNSDYAPSLYGGSSEE